MSVDGVLRQLLLDYCCVILGVKAILNMSKLQKEREGGEVKTFYYTYNVHNRFFPTHNKINFLQ